MIWEIMQIVKVNFMYKTKIKQWATKMILYYTNTLGGLRTSSEKSISNQIFYINLQNKNSLNPEESATQVGYEKNLKIL